MAENQETNSFLEAMGTSAENPETTEIKETTLNEDSISEIEKISKYAVSPAAESTVSTVATILLIIGIIAGVVGVLGGLIEFSDDEAATAWAFLGTGVGGFLSGLITWASLKVFVNISRSLYNINDVLHEIKNK